MNARWIGLITACAICAMPLHAAAQDHDDAPHTARSDEHETHVGVRFSGGNSYATHHTARTMGVGVLGEYVFWDHHLEVEAVGQLVRHGEAMEVFEELAIKAPWHVTDHLDVFVGVGAMLCQHAQWRALSGGVLAMTGATYWRGDHWGVSLEMEVMEDLALHAHDVEGVIAVLYRFGHH